MINYNGPAPYDYWHFNIPVTEDSLILCTKCQGTYRLGDWAQYESGGCDSCWGEHNIMECPECYENYDSIWADTFTVVAP